MAKLEFSVFENGEQLPIIGLSEPECAAIEECILAMLPNPKGNYWFEVDTVLLDQDEPVYGLVYCLEENPNPKNRSKAETDRLRPLPKELEELNGQRVRIAPRQLGLSPWGDLVEILFRLS